MSRRRALGELSAALRGEPPADADWMALLRLSNQALVTPQIHAAALRTGAAARLPAEVQAFTGEVLARNRERNRRLFRQLREALLPLNAAGIEPVLLKGAALWASLGRPQPFDRMLNDLDVLVSPAEAPRAVEALTEAGFAVAKAHAGPDVHVVAELGRAQDVGFIDLHQRPPGPPGLAELGDLASRCRAVAWEGVRARVPEPAVQVFFLVLHDQFHDGIYWRGGIALRHLLDIAALAEGAQPMDWALLDVLAKTRLAAHAVAAELAAARAIAGARVPQDVGRGRWARLQHARHMAQFRWPWLAAPLAAVGAASEAGLILAHRRANARDRRRLFGPERRGGLPDALDRLRQILAGAAAGLT